VGVRIFSRGTQKDFSRGVKSGKFHFTHSKLRKRPFLLKISCENVLFQNPRFQETTAPPSNARVPYQYLDKIVKVSQCLSSHLIFKKPCPNCLNRGGQSTACWTFLWPSYTQCTLLAFFVLIECHRLFYSKNVEYDSRVHSDFSKQINSCRSNNSKLLNLNH